MPESLIAVLELCRWDYYARVFEHLEVNHELELALAERSCTLVRKIVRSFARGPEGRTVSGCNLGVNFYRH